MAVSALAQWFGGNRLLAPHVGDALEGCKWVGVVFAGGMSEIPCITARTILVNDLHCHVINLARVVGDPNLRVKLIQRLRWKAFHPVELKVAQDYCRNVKPSTFADLDAAENYFVCCWMSRSGKAGGKDEFHGRTATRWNADGGDSAVRYHSAIRALTLFGRVFRKCTFETMDAFDFLLRCEDEQDHGIYADPPFPKAGRKYLHNAGNSDSAEREWHTKLRNALVRFQKTRMVCRFYDHPMIRELYPEPEWAWNFLGGGKKQTNEDAPEVLLVRNGPRLLF